MGSWGKVISKDTWSLTHHYGGRAKRAKVKKGRVSESSGVPERIEFYRIR
jgi:hypothetical protein